MSVANVAGEVFLWIGRVLTILPAFQAMWDAAKAGNPEQELVASLEMMRAIKTQQAREEIR